MPDYIYNTIKKDVSLPGETTEDNKELKSTRFIIFGDSKGKNNGINEKILRKIMYEIEHLNPEPQYIVILGDSIDGSKQSNILKIQLDSYNSLVRSYHPSKTIVPVLGNHEVAHRPKDDTAERVFVDCYCKFNPDGRLEEYNGTVYYLDVDNIRIIVLNSHHCGETKRISDKQLEWLKEIAGAPMEHKLVFLHTPPYPTGAHLGTCLDKFPEQRDKFWKVIDESNVDIVFAGHEHNYSRRVIDSTFNTTKYEYSNKIYQIVTGGGGEKLRQSYDDKRGVIIPPKAVYHFVILDVEGKNINIQAISIDGKKVDEFAINK